MTLKFADFEKIEPTLIAEGQGSDPSAVLERIADFLKHTKVSAEIYEDFTRLADVARSKRNSRAVELALGLLIHVCNEMEKEPQKCHDLIEFVRQRVESMESGRAYWANVILSDHEEKDALALFEAAIGDTSYSTIQLRDAANRFIEDHKGEHSTAGRLASDLIHLLEIFNDDERQESHRARARAALTYFVEEADAIPDKLDLVGRIDDIFIAQRALEEIVPNRGNLTRYLEKKLIEWPFLKNLEFEIDEENFPISDFMLINCGLLLDVLQVNSRSSVIIVPEAEPLLYLLGLVAALARVAEIVKSEDKPRFVPGDKLVPRDGGASVSFVSYGRLLEEDHSFRSEDASVASHVQILHPPRGRQSEVVRTIPLAQLGNFQRTGIDGDKRRRPKIKIDIGKREIGPLERLMGTTQPIMLDVNSPLVLVVAPIGKSKVMANTLKLFGVVSTNVVPTAHLWRIESGFDMKHWTQDGMGGTPLLCIVNSIDEAYDIVSLTYEGYEDVHSQIPKLRKISTVVAPVRQVAADSVQLARIAEKGIKIVAFVEPENKETLDIFNDRGMSFWSWDKEWLDLLYWPELKRCHQSPLADYEHRVKRRLNSNYVVKTVPFNELTRAIQILSSMETKSELDEMNSLDDWVIKAWWFLLELCRCVTPVGPAEEIKITSKMQKLDDDLTKNLYRWEETMLARARELIVFSRKAIRSLADRNPKYELLQQLDSQLSGGTVIVLECDRVALTDALSGMNLKVVSRNDSGREERTHIVPAWYGRSRMEKLILGSTADELQLLLYEPEAEWFGLFLKHREDSIRHVKELVERNASIPIDRTQEDRPSSDDIIPQFSNVDEIFRSAIRRDAHKRTDDESVKAKIVGFVGGAWAAFTLTHKVRTVSHLFDPDNENFQEIKMTKVTQLRSGDMVLMLSDSDRDAVRDHAEQKLKPSTIQAAEAWKVSLGDFVSINPDLNELQAKLAQEGCDKTISTIRYWINSDYAIGPQDKAREIAAIARAIGDDRLIDNEKECVESISAVRNAHIAAGKRIAQQVVLRAREWAKEGATADDLLELEDRLLIAVVDFVDDEESLVSANRVNRPMSRRSY